MKYRNPDLANNMLPTLAQIKSYVKKAIVEDKQYRDVRPLMSLLQKLPQVDSRMFAVQQTRKLAIFGFPYTIQFPKDAKPDSTDLKRLEQIKRRFSKSKMQSLFNVVGNGNIFGMAATRLKWDNTGSDYGTMVTAKKNLELTELDYDLDNDLNMIHVITNLNSTQQKVDLDPDIYFIIKNNAFDGITDDFPGGLARINFIISWLKYSDFFNWASANEKFGDPITIAQYDKNKTDPKDLDEIDKGLEDLGTAARARFSKDIELKFIEAMRSGIVDMHDKFVQAVNTELAISYLGQNLTTEVKGGSYAATESQNQVRMDYLYADIMKAQDDVSEQYLVKDWKMNYNDEPKNGYPELHINTDEVPDFESFARNYEALKAADPSMKFIKKEVYEKTGWTPPKAGTPAEELI